MDSLPGASSLIYCIDIVKIWFINKLLQMAERRKKNMKIRQIHMHMYLEINLKLRHHYTYHP